MHSRVAAVIFIFIFLLALQVDSPLLSQEKTKKFVTAPWQLFDQLRIKPGFYHLGIQRENKWVSSCITNPTSATATFYLRFHNPHLNQIILYKNHSLQPSVITGDWFPFSQRPLLFRDFLLPVSVAPHQTDSLLLCLNKRGESLSFQYEIIPADALLPLMTRDNFWLGLVICFVVIVAIVAFFIGVSLKEPLYFIFGIYSILALAWLLNNTGVLFQFGWPDHVLWHYKSRTFFSVLSISAYLFFLYRFFASRIRTIDRVLFSSFIIFLLLKLYGVLSAPQVEYKLTRKYFFVLFSAAGLLAFLLYLIYFFVRNFKQSRPHHFHLAAFLVYTLLIVHETLLQFGISIFPFTGIADYVPFVFFFIQLVLMLVGFSVWTMQRVNKSRLQALFQVRAEERAISSQQFDLLENERSRIGRDVHDQLGGLLVSIKLNLSNLKLKFYDTFLHREVDRLHIIVDSSINQLHQVVHDLVPPKLTAENFEELVRDRIRLYAEASAVQFNVAITLPASITPTLLVHVYRIICEFINNSIQHSQCSHISITCQRIDHYLQVEYTDNGHGFEPGSAKEGRGLHNIQSRVKLMKGRMEYKTVTKGMCCQLAFDLNESYETDTLLL